MDYVTRREGERREGERREGERGEKRKRKRKRKRERKLYGSGVKGKVTPDEVLKKALPMSFSATPKTATAQTPDKPGTDSKSLNPAPPSYFYAKAFFEW